MRLLGAAALLSTVWSQGLGADRGEMTPAPPAQAPVVTWATPAAVPPGTVLGAAQLNATANVPGTFYYSPAAGTVLQQDAGYVLSVMFVPADDVTYQTVWAWVRINVVRPPRVAHGLEPAILSAFAPGDLPGGLVEAHDRYLFGTTRQGGANGFGTTFRFLDGVSTTLHVFTGGADGAYPNAPLYQALDSLGYGTTVDGGAGGGLGTVFRTELNGTLTTLHTFHGGDGAHPGAGVIQGTDGQFYGTTTAGGAGGKGTIFKLNQAWQLTTLHSFTGPDGESPAAALLQGHDGRFYGTTRSGGGGGAGTIFAIDASGTFTTLHEFGVSDGADPSGRLFQTADGRFVGTTRLGGPHGLGTIFSFLSSGAFATLYEFTGGTDGSHPESGVMQAADGRIYGTTTDGGESGLGTAFRFDDPGVAVGIVQFNGQNGSGPQAGLAQGTGGEIYGVTSAGGAFDGGVVFTLPTVTWQKPASIAYGTALGPAQLNASSLVDGTFSYTPPSGTVLLPGPSRTLSMTFTPIAPGSPVTGSVTIEVLRATPTIDWPTPSSISFGTALGPAQLNASAGVPGTFSYSPAAGTVLGAGGHALSVTFTPDDTVLYQPATASVTLTVTRAMPSLSWPAPDDIVAGTPLGGAELDATAAVAGTFAYTPAAGTVLAAGSRTLSALFTPADATNYTTATITTVLQVVNTRPVLVNPGNQINSDGSPYSYAVLVDAPAAYWRLDETAGTAVADSAGANPATRFGGVTLAQTGPLADGGVSMRFDGATGYLRAANPSFLLSGDLTLELWVNSSLTGRQTLVSKGHLNEFELTLEPWGQLNFYQGNGSTYEEVPLSFAGIAANTWHHVVLTRTAATRTVRLYVNGALKGSRTYTGTIAAGTRPITIGRSDGGSKHVNGRLDEVAIYPGVLTAAQAAAHYAVRATTGAVVALQLVASDPNGDSLSYSATGLPPSLGVNASTGLVSGTLGAADAGTYQVTATASDGSLSHGQTFTWTVDHVNRAPVLTNPGDQAHLEHTTLSLQLSGSDPENDTLSYGASGLPPGLSINAVTGFVSGTLPTASAGDYLVRIVADDGHLSTSQTFTWTVISTNRAPVLTNPGAQINSAISGYSPLVLSHSPIGYWRLDDATGSIAADSAATANGTIAGGVTLGESGALAESNAAMRFNGSTGHILVPSPATDLSGDLTLELWVNASSAGRQTLLSKGSRNEFELTLEPWGQLNFYHGNGVSFEEVALPSARVAASTWQHVVLTRTAATKNIRVYIDGVLKENRTYSLAPVAGSTAISIGRSAAGSKYVNGRLDEVAVYATALDAARVLAHYEQRTTATNTTSVSLQLVAADPDEDTISYTATGLPPSLTVNSATGLISGTLATDGAGLYHVTATASDGRLSHSQSFTWRVTGPNRAPLVTNPGPQVNSDTAGYAAAVLADGAAAYWRLAEAGGPSSADLAGGNSASIYGNPALAQPGALAAGNPSMRFDGSTAHLRAADPGFALNGDLTIELWLNVTLGARQTLVSKGYQYEFELTLEPTGQMNFYHGAGTSYEEIPMPFAGISANTWQHVVVTRTASPKTIRLYVNGILRGSRAYTGTVSEGARPISIGRSDGGTKYVNGRLDEVALYRTALGGAEVSAHYAERLTAGTASPIALQIAAADADGDALTYSAAGLPAGLSIDSATGLVTGSLASTPAGVYQVTVTASDGYLSQSQTFTWTVAHGQ